MRSTQLKVREAIQAGRRRWKLVLIPVVLLTVLSGVGSHFLPRKYESSTTILVRPDQTLRTMAGYEMAMAFEEELRNFNEILFSRTLLLALADSLGFNASSKTDPEKLVIAQVIGSSIATARLGSDSFRIQFTDSDPVRAQRGARVIADLFIQMKLAVDNRQNASTVDFYEKKVQEYRAAFDASAETLVSEMKQNVDELPLEARSLYSQVDDVQRNIAASDGRIKTNREALDYLKKLFDMRRLDPGALHTDLGKQYLLELQREDVPSSADLKTLLSHYDETARRYTSNYPEVVKLENQIVTQLERMQKVVESEIAKLQTQKADLDTRRAQIIEQLKQSSTNTKMSADKQSNYDMYRKLYDDIQLKLEQARLTQEVASRGANQFFIIDPAYVPVYPSQPKRSRIMIGGFGLGLLLGVVAAMVTELLDTTIRTTKDIEIYQKPVIALLPEGSRR